MASKNNNSLAVLLIIFFLGNLSLSGCSEVAEQVEKEAAEQAAYVAKAELASDTLYPELKKKPYNYSQDEVNNAIAYYGSIPNNFQQIAKNKVQQKVAYHAKIMGRTINVTQLTLLAYIAVNHVLRSQSIRANYLGSNPSLPLVVLRKNNHFFLSNLSLSGCSEVAAKQVAEYVVTDKLASKTLYLGLKKKPYSYAQDEVNDVLRSQSIRGNCLGSNPPLPLVVLRKNNHNTNNSLIKIP